MRFSPRLAFALAPSLIALAACSSSPSNGTGGETTTSTTTTSGTGTGGAAAVETCTATFQWLQKDAYKDTAGRTTSLWPPHTTTTLAITCQVGEDGPVEQVGSAFHANHGTEPSAVDANGDVFLVEIRADEIKGSREDLLDLLAKYEACECDAATKFLSLDSLQDAAVDALLKNVVAYFQTHLSCTSAGGVDALIQALQAGDFDQVLTDLPTCSWDSGSDLASGFDEALSTFLATTQEVLAGYHVCNNDAELQANLFLSTAGGKKAVACDANQDLCKGPKWFYDP